jgi:phage baseplate assembly protein W
MAYAILTNNYPDADLDLDFLRNPTTSDVVRKTGEEAIKRSVRNLIFTNFYDRPFRSYIGCSVRQILFENMGPLTETFLETAIRDVINNFEPRVRLISVKVSADFDRNGYSAGLEYIINNRETPIITSLFLERIR